MLTEDRLNYTTTEKELPTYTTTRKEFLTVVFAIHKFRSYLVRAEVIVCTDHVALKYLLTKKDAKPYLIR